MIIAAAVVIAVVAVTVMVACYRATDLYIEVKNYKIKDEERKEDK